jgi:hypothetical protein
MSVATMAARDAVYKMLVRSQIKAQSVYGRVNRKVNSKANRYIGLSNPIIGIGKMYSLKPDYAKIIVRTLSAFPKSSYTKRIEPASYPETGRTTLVTSQSSQDE